MEALKMLVTSKSHDHIEMRVKACIRAFYAIQPAGLYNSDLSTGIKYLETFNQC